MSGSKPATGHPLITPFWLRYPTFFVQPLSWEPFLYTVLLSAVSLLVIPLNFLFPPFLSLGFVLFSIWVACLLKTYQSFELSARGMVEAQSQVFYSRDDESNLPYKQLVIWLIVGAFVWVSSHLGMLVSGFVLLIILFLLPASMLTLLVTRSLFIAINPVACWAMVRTIGLAYLGLFTPFILFYITFWILADFFVTHVSLMVTLPFLNFVAMYFFWVMAYMLGYAAYQYHEVLGIGVNYAPDRELSRVDQKRGEAAEIERLVNAGHIEEAIDFAYEAQRIASEDIDAHERYHHLLIQVGKQERRLKAHALQYLTLLFNKGWRVRGLELYERMRTLDPSFAPQDPEHFFRLAEAARELRQFDYALQLVEGYETRFPYDPFIPEVRLFVAEVLSENLYRDEEAQLVLTDLLTRFPEDRVTVRAKQLLLVIERMLAAKAAEKKDV